MDIRNEQDQPITLSQQPYLQGGTRAHANTVPFPAADSWYQADGVDADGVEYRIYWEIVNADFGDESEACNWDEFTVTYL